MNKNLILLIAGVAALGTLTGVLVAKVILSGQRTAADEQLPRSEVSWERPKSLEQVVPSAIQWKIREARIVRASLVANGRLLFGGDTARVDVVLPGGMGYSRQGSSVLLSHEQAMRLRTTLLDVRSYQTQAKDCLFLPTVAYVFTADDDSVITLICHPYDHMLIFAKGNGGGGEVDPAGRALVGLTHELFPEDTLVAGLWTRRRE